MTFTPKYLPKGITQTNPSINMEKNSPNTAYPPDHTLQMEEP